MVAAGAAGNEVQQGPDRVLCHRENLLCPRKMDSFAVRHYSTRDADMASIVSPAAKHCAPSGERCLPTGPLSVIMSTHTTLFHDGKGGRRACRSRAAHIYGRTKRTEARCRSAVDAGLYHHHAGQRRLHAGQRHVRLRPEPAGAGLYRLAAAVRHLHRHVHGAPDRRAYLFRRHP